MSVSGKQKFFSRQLALDLGTPAAPSFDNFVAGPNDWLIARLRALASPRCFDALYVWGPEGSGRTHLLRAAAREARSAGRPVMWVAAPGVHDDLSPPLGALVLADDVESLDEGAQLALFRAFNTARLVGLAMLVAGGQPPLRQRVREDLRTRLGAMLVFELKALGDEDKARTLLKRANERGLRLAAGVIEHLLRHERRDLTTLLGILDMLDRASLEQQRPITIPLLRRILRAPAVTAANPAAADAAPSDRP